MVSRLFFQSSGAAGAPINFAQAYADLKGIAAPTLGKQYEC